MVAAMAVAATESGRLLATRGVLPRGGPGKEDRGAPNPRSRALHLTSDNPSTPPTPPAMLGSVDDLRLAFTRAARRLEALARGRRSGGKGGSGGGAPNYLHGLFEVEAALARSSRDLHGQAFPGGAEGAGARRGPPPRGRAGRGGAPREVYIEGEEELDLEAQEGDALMYGDGYGPTRRGSGEGGGRGGGSGRGGARRGRR
jgi:hypothetical protein